jgi:hypothetical protein
MRTRLIAAALAVLPTLAALAQPLTTAFTFQGRLDNAGSPANGVYDFQFALFDAPAGGSQLGTTLCSDNVAVSGGIFTAPLDFGSQFTGSQRFLEVRVRHDTGLTCGNATGFTTLTPRQNLTAAPNAVFSLSAANAAQLNSQPASFYLAASNLTGTLADARLTANVALLSGAQTFSGAKAFSAPTTMSTLNLSAPGTGIIFGPGSGALITAGEDNTVARRMWLAHSETFSAWGIQYRDTSSDGFAGDSIEIVSGNQTRPLFGFVLGTPRSLNGYDPMGATTISLNALTGAAQFNGGVSQSYAGINARATPVAYGVVDASGTVLQGSSPNVFNAAWDAANLRYEITITGETYTPFGYTVTVTPVDTGFALIPGTNAVNGHLIVILRTISGARSQGQFDFIMYKPF